MPPAATSGQFARPPGPDAAACFNDTRQHLMAELECLDLYIQAQVARARARHQADEQFQGLYISEQEIDELLARPAGLPRWAMLAEDPAASLIAGAVAEIRAGLDQKAAESLRLGIDLRLLRLAGLFSLTRFDLDVLLVCLAPELDARYDRFYGYLHDDVTRKRPTVDLTLNLLCRTLPEKLAMRSRFEANSPLIEQRLIQVFDDPSQPHSTLLAQCLRLDSRVVQYLLGSEHIDTRLAGLAACYEPCMTLESLILPEQEAARLRHLALQATQSGTVFYLHGPYGAGKRATAETIAGVAGRRLLVIDGLRVAAAEPAAAETHVKLILREARLLRAAIVWEGFGALLLEDRSSLRRLLLAEIERAGDTAFLTGEALWEPMDELHRSNFVRLELRTPEFPERGRMWRAALSGEPIEEGDIAPLANKFRFTGGQIEDALATARSLAGRRGPEAPAITLHDLYEASRLQSNGKLSALARKIKPCYAWNDIVLPPDRLQQLREICNCVKYRPIVFGQWGFDGKLALGKGLNVLFAGPPGTGKTMAAEIIAGELALDLYKIDLSAMVSKYIGETEKNLARIFTEAESSNSILFFDEADALFGKRSEVRDSHDRYANIEIGYLLQRMEEYEGVVILATNFRKNMDDAFVRRLQFSLEFPFPGERDRVRIWDGVWPDTTPRGDDVDLGWMARQFELTGGSIRNIALSAAFLAASNGGAVKMPHLLHATRREYQKMGKVVREGEFGLGLDAGLKEGYDV